jgi:ABC-type multidrug transport system fused ATPase/permease subunit
VYYADLSGMGTTYPVYRDIFMFQCLIGCRVSDLNRLTKANIVDGFVEYIPQKTKMEHAGTVRVPLNRKALDILERYKDLENALLPRFSHFGYNKKIKEILKYVGIDRKVIVLDPKTREDVARPLYEVASTHTARKTFIGNLYRQVKDPNLIASMSGHSEGSRAFARYRKIDDEILSHEIQTGASTMDPKGYDIAFSHVGFSYDSQDTVLRDVTFTAKQGEVTALIGPSGGGKTTVSRLASRFWDIVQAGRQNDRATLYPKRQNGCQR